MRRLELICDGCGKVAGGDESHFRLPKVWYIVGFHCQTFVGHDDWRVIYHFCSSECMDKVMNVLSRRPIKGT